MYLTYAINWQVIIINCGAKLGLVPETLTIGQLLDGVANRSNLATSRMLKHTVKRGRRQRRKENVTVTLKKNMLPTPVPTSTTNLTIERFSFAFTANVKRQTAGCCLS